MAGDDDDDNDDDITVLDLVYTTAVNFCGCDAARWRQ